MHDKFKSCKDCPDRSIQPNCHTTCEGYLARCKERAEIRKARAEDYETIAFDKAVSKKARRIHEQQKRRK